MRNTASSFFKTLVLRKHSAAHGLFFLILGCCIVMILGFPSISSVGLFIVCGVSLILSRGSAYLSDNMEKLFHLDNDKNQEELYPYENRYLFDRLFFLSTAVLSGLLGFSMLFPFAWITFPAAVVAVKGFYNIIMIFTDGRRRYYDVLNVFMGTYLVFLSYAHRNPTEQSLEIEQQESIHQGLFLAVTIGAAVYRIVKMIGIYKEDKEFTYDCKEELQCALLNIGLIIWNVLCHCVLKW